MAGDAALAIRELEVAGYRSVRHVKLPLRRVVRTI